MSSFDNTGLVMTGGGARGAYQAGVLKRVGSIPRLRNRPGPFKIINGSSAGSVNGVALAAGNFDFERCTSWLAELWSGLSSDQVFRSDLPSLFSLSGRMLRDLSFGGIFGGGHAQSLLDFSPLRGFLSKHIRFELIQKNIDRNNLKAFCIASTNYESGKTFLFIQAQPGHALWQKSRRVAVSATITVDHICASAAIPVVFQPIKLTTEFGASYFGDGCLRMTAPLSPAIRLGAERILAIGVRSKTATQPHVAKPIEEKAYPPPLAQVLGVAFNAIFLDHLDTDVEHLERLNQIIKHGNLTGRTIDGIKEPMKIVRPLALSPSHDIGKVAELYKEKMPAAVRYFLEGLGTQQAPSSDLLSYLLFDSNYLKALVEMGYRDADARRDEIEDFLFSEQK